MGTVNKEQEGAARADLESALRRCAEVVQAADPSIGVEAIAARHKQFDQLCSLAVKSVQRVHGAWARSAPLGQQQPTEVLSIMQCLGSMEVRSRALVHG